MSRKGPWIVYQGELWTKAELDAHRAHEAAKKRGKVVKVRRPKRGRYVLRNGKLVPIVAALPQRQSGGGPNVIRDIEPYQAIGLPGAPWIKGGRAEHRAMLRRYGKVEVGTAYDKIDLREKVPVTMPAYSFKQHLADLVYKRRPM